MSSSYERIWHQNILGDGSVGYTQQTPDDRLEPGDCARLHSYTGAAARLGRKNRVCDCCLRALLRGRPFAIKSPRSVSELTEQALDIPSNTIIDDVGSGFAYFFKYFSQSPATSALEFAFDMPGATDGIDTRKAQGRHLRTVLGLPVQMDDVVVERCQQTGDGPRLQR